MTTDARIVARLLVRADQLDDYAAACRREGIVSGPEGAEDAELAAQECRGAAEMLDLREGPDGSSRRIGI